jgi:sortase B
MRAMQKENKYGEGDKILSKDAVLSPSPKHVKDQKRKKGSVVWRVVFVAALLVLIASLSAIGYIAFTYWSGQDEYNQLIDDSVDIVETQGITTLSDFKIDWDALKAKNPDTVGWIYVPDTVINYPIVWREDDDQYYLTHSFGDNSVGSFGAEYGCIMLSGKNDPDWTDEVNIVYGHNMLNGSMFATLAKFTSSEEFNAHRTIYILTPNGNFKLTTFAVNKVLGTSTDIVIPNFATTEEFQNYVQARLSASVVDADPAAPAAEAIKQVFAFSTCSSPDDQYRIVTFATVDEYLPTGASSTKDSSYVDASDIEDVNSLSQERTS